MSAMSPHIRVLRAEAEALAYHANECGDDSHALLLARLSAAKSMAAAQLEAEEPQLREETPIDFNPRGKPTK